jgi:hypothetical protein
LVLIAMPTLAWAQPAPRSPGPVDPFPEDPPPQQAPPPDPAPPPPPADDAVPAAPDPAPAPAARSDDTIAPSEVPVDAPPPLPPYPRSFVDRPVVLPRGVYVLSISGAMGRDSVADSHVDSVVAHVGGAFGFDRFDLGVGVDLGVFHDDNFDMPIDSPVFQRALVGASLRLPAESFVAVQGIIGSVGSRRQRYSPSLFVGHKFRPSESAAIYVSGGVDYNYGHEVDYGDNVYVSHRVAAFAGGTARVQAAPLVALQVSGSVAQYKYIDEHNYNTTVPFRELSGGAAVLLSAGKTADVSAFFSISSTGPIVSVDGGLGVSVRSR